VLVPNPEFKSQGDFSLDGNRLSNRPPLDYTYAGIGVYHPDCFASFQPGESFALGPWLRRQAEQQLLSGEVFTGLWMDIGTPERLQQLENLLHGESDADSGVLPSGTAGGKH
jgi:MurNAc alpha-1-phosphate uridylyltransferase